MLKKIKRWWNGNVFTYEDKNVFGVGVDRHWTSRAAHSVVGYIIKHQAWIMPTIITAVVAIVLARPWKW